jgi:hypothetical protein
VTVANVTAEHQDPIGTGAECSQNHLWRDPPGAHHPDGQDVSGGRHTGDACIIRSSIGAPVAKESDNLWFEILTHSGYPLKAYV